MENLNSRLPRPAKITKSGSFKLSTPAKIQRSLSSEGDMTYSAVRVDLISLSPLSNEDPITLVVQMQNKSDIYYKMGKGTPLQALMTDYCNRVGYPEGSLRFFTGEALKLNGGQTPRQLGLEDYEVIDAYSDVLGG